MQRRFVLICFNLLVAMISYGQQGSKISFGFSPSSLLKIGDRNTYAIPNNPSILNMAYTFPNRLRSEWQKYWKYPQISVQSFALNMDSPEVLGHVYGVLPSFTYKIIYEKQSGLGIFGTFGSGLAYATKPFDKLSNPLNNAIGSNLNNISHFNIEVRLKMSKYSASLGHQLTHISNARSATPNTGYNLHGWQLTISRHGLDKNNLAKPQKDIDSIRRWGGDVLLGYGVSEHSFTGGSKYASYWVSSGLKYNWGTYLMTTIGAEYEYNQSTFQFFNQDFVSENVAAAKATQSSIFIAQRLRFGYVAVRFQAGIYLPYPEVERTRHPNYLRIGIDIHPLNGRYRMDPYLGISLKSHKAVAQYLGLSSGVLF